MSISEKAMAPHSSTLAWKIPRTEEPGRLQSMGSPRVGHDWVTSLALFTFMHWRRKWQPTPVFLPGESQGRGSLVGYPLWGRTESDGLKWLSGSNNLIYLALREHYNQQQQNTHSFQVHMYHWAKQTLRSSTKQVLINSGRLKQQKLKLKINNKEYKSIPKRNWESDAKFEIKRCASKQSTYQKTKYIHTREIRNILN